MNQTNGIFICPKCNYNGIIWNNFKDYQKGNFKRWKCREEYINDKLEKKYVFYNRQKQEKWYCCCCCGENSCGKCWKSILTWKFFRSEDNSKDGLRGGSDDNCCLMIIFGIFYLVFFIITSIFYILFFIWADIINYCCGCKRKTNYYLVGKFENNFETSFELNTIKDNIILIENVEYIKKDNIEDNKIWQYAYSKKKWNSVGPWICPQCKYALQSFEGFIPNIIIDTFTDTDNTDNEFISVQFQSIDGQINHSIPCQKKEIFSNVVNKLFIQYPEYKNKNCFFLQNGNQIQLNKNLKDNKITSGIPIILEISDL